MERISSTDMRAKLPGAIQRAALLGERFVLTVRGKPQAAIVPLEDLEALERLEDEEDAREAEAVLVAIERGEEETVPLAEVVRKHRAAP